MSDIDHASLGRLGAFVMHSRYSARESTRPARAAFMARFEREVDPQGVLEAGDRAARASAAKRAFMSRLSMKSAAVRRERAAAEALARAKAQ